MTADDEAIWRERAVALRAAREERGRESGERPDSGRYLIARTRAQEYALPLARVAGVMPVGADPTLCPVPDAPPALWSLYVVRGEVRPVFDARLLLPGNPARADDESAPERSPWIVLVRPEGSEGDGRSATEYAEPEVGLLFDEVESIVSGHAEVVGDGAASETVAGQLVRDLEAESRAEQTALIVDLSALLGALRTDRHGSDGEDVSDSGLEDGGVPGDVEAGRRSEETGRL